MHFILRGSEVINALGGLLRIIEGESGAGTNYWEKDPKYLRARVLHARLKSCWVKAQRLGLRPGKLSKRHACVSERALRERIVDLELQLATERGEKLLLQQKLWKYEPLRRG